MALSTTTDTIDTSDTSDTSDTQAELEAMKDTVSQWVDA
jgi:hypothetical protein